MTSKLDEELSALFNVPATIQEAVPEIAITRKEIMDTVKASRKLLSDDSLVTDVELVQTSVRTVIEKGVQALGELAEQAIASQDSERYTALAAMIKSMTEANMSMLELRERAISLENNRVHEDEPDGKSVVNNNLFVGTTADLMEMIRMQTGGRGLDVSKDVIDIEPDAIGVPKTLDSSIMIPGQTITTDE